MGDGAQTRRTDRGAPAPSPDKTAGLERRRDARKEGCAVDAGIACRRRERLGTRRNAMVDRKRRAGDPSVSETAMNGAGQSRLADQDSRPQCRERAAWRVSDGVRPNRER